MATSRHPTLSRSFGARAQTATHPLASYLFRLMELKQSNLALSADVHTARELVYLADRVGPSIVVLKTHYDLVAGWDGNAQTGTGAQLAALAHKHGFLLFEDRKFNDIGKTVQAQYTGGNARVVEWAHITNATMTPGRDMVDALAAAAAKWRERVHYEVRTSVTVGTPVQDSFDEAELQHGPNGNGHGMGMAVDEEDELDEEEEEALRQKHQHAHLDGFHAREQERERDRLRGSFRDMDNGRKGSIVSVTTVTQSFEPVSSPRLPQHGMDSIGGGSHGTDDALFPGIEEAPLERGLLLVAQMSSRGNLFTKEITQASVEAARARRDFVMGFVAQESLNTLPDDNFIHMTPGCKLPPEGEEEENGTRAGEAGQQYNTPAKLIGVCGADIVIVGEGITKAGDLQSEAERYRRRAWKAYLARING